MEKKKLFFNFKKKIENNINNNKFSIIAEMKRMSPSTGVLIHADKYNPVGIAKGFTLLSSRNYNAGQ